MKAKLWREKSKGELEKELITLVDRARTLRFDLATRESKTHRTYRETKRDIARVKTILTEER